MRVAEETPSLLSHSSPWREGLAWGGSRNRRPGVGPSPSDAMRCPAGTAVAALPGAVAQTLCLSLATCRTWPKSTSFLFLQINNCFEMISIHGENCISVLKARLLTARGLDCYWEAREGLSRLAATSCAPREPEEAVRLQAQCQAGPEGLPSGTRDRLGFGDRPRRGWGQACGPALSLSPCEASGSVGSSPTFHIWMHTGSRGFPQSHMFLSHPNVPPTCCGGRSHRPRDSP